MKLKIILALLMIAVGSPAYAQCSGQPASGLVCGNNAALAQLPAWSTITLLFDRGLGATQGAMLNRGASVWSATSTPSLGLNGGTGGALTLNGSSTGAVTIGVKSAAGSTTFNLPVGNGTNGFVLQTDGFGNTSWASVAGTGTVTSVGLALPGIFSVSGTPITSSGTLTGTLATQSSNLVWAGPATGAASAPTFRSLVGADLPAPTTGSLGGVQANSPISHQWINAVNTSGVPQLSQPAFSDISGVITPAQCPNPSASTIGCVESYVAVSHQWINAISTSGVPSSTQPSFTDINGSISLAQLPSITNNAVLGNNSGGTAVPSALSATNVLDMINNVQGDVLYRSASGWTALAPGTSGQVLTTGGASANPAWQTVTGTGTVTSVATNNGITGGTITTTGTIGLATIATGNVLAYTGAGSGVPVATTPSGVLDVLGSATGDILYRAAGGTGWTVLAPGSNGQVLTMGASTPSWTSASTVSNVVISPGGSITATGTCNITTSGTCTVGLSTTPNIGAATGTSLALNSATLGGADLAVPTQILIGPTPAAGASLLIDATVVDSGSHHDVAAVQLSPLFPNTITDDAAGMFVVASVAASGAISNVYNIRSENASKGSGASITNLYGFKVDNLTAGTNNYGVASDINSSSPNSTANWGNGTLTPSAPYHVNRNAVTSLSAPTDTTLYSSAADGHNNNLTLDVYQNGSFRIPGIDFRLARGTGASPTAVGSGDFLGLFGAYGYTGAGSFTTTASALIAFVATENFVDATHQGTRVDIGATPNGSGPNVVAASFFGDKSISVGTTNDGGANGILTNPTTVASLGTCSSTAKGSRKFVTDANSTTFHATAVGSGSNNMAVVCDGTVWYID